MSRHPKIRLSRLRQIGWSLWDPIRLNEVFDGKWEESGNEDEYDSYLLKVAGMIRRNEDNQAAVDYLVWAETENMGMKLCADTLERAQATIDAIRVDDQLWSDEF